MAAKSSFKYIDYHAAVLASSIKDAARYCEAMKAMLSAHGWTDDEYIKHREPMFGYRN